MIYVTLVCVVGLASLALASLAAEPAPHVARLQVLKRGDTVLVRSPFDSTCDLVTWVRKGGNNALIFSVWRMAPSDELAAVSIRGNALKGAGPLIHNCGDNTTPWLINDGYIGGNHGCPSVCCVTSPDHGRTVADIGGVWQDEPGGGTIPTCVYWHPEDDAQLVYADYHGPVERNAIRLPAAWAGRPVAVVEKTPSLTLHDKTVGPQGDRTVSVTGEYGYGVFQIRE